MAEADYTDEEEVVEFCKDQRPAQPGEPVCIVCGKYGAYICDATDEDVCSIQCKQAHLSKVQEVNTETSTKEISITSDTLFEHLILSDRCENVLCLFLSFKASCH